MKQKNLVLMVVAVGCGLVAAFLTTQINAKGPKIEQVEVLVAKKDLAVGTQFTKSEMEKLVTKKLVPKESLPANFVNEEADLLDKRLSAPVPAESFFIPAFLSTRGVIILPEGKDMVSLPIGLGSAAAGFIGPGAHVDILATMRLGNKLASFPVLVDMQILAVDTNTKYSGTGAYANLSMVSLAVTQEEALLLGMAKQRGCHMELLLRNPSKPIDPNYDIRKIAKLLQDDSPIGTMPTEDSKEREPRTDTINPETVPPVNNTQIVENKTPDVKTTDLKTPDLKTTDIVKAPEPKVATVKVYRAIGDIEANTEITKDLIDKSFSAKEVTKETAETFHAYADLTPLLGQVFKIPVAKDQVVSKGMVGPPVSKVAPPEPFVVDKPDPTKPDPVKPQPKKAPEKRTYDVAFHTTHGTEIHRYEEYKPGEWRLQQILHPAEAARKSAGSAGEATPDNQQPATPDKKSD